jgi:AcrR family transcriptional regulator
MRIGTPRKRITKSADERRQDLMDAAVQVFAEKGIARTTVSDITGVAAVAKGTFYLYFDSKDHLLGALKERFVDQILQHAAKLYDQVGREDWWSLVDETVETFVDFTIRQKDLIHVFVQEGITPETSQTFAECDRKVDAMFAAGIEAGVKAGVFRSTDPELTATLLHHGIEGSLRHAILYGEGEPDRERLITAARELTHKVLAP